MADSVKRQDLTDDFQPYGLGPCGALMPAFEKTGDKQAVSYDPRRENRNHGFHGDTRIIRELHRLIDSPDGCSSYA
ncbi:MAG: hypothetical protein MUF31_07295 [Akkermansiaceae bacterium]|nr:hypothetical protein [Akkermansiaceae bacterium]